MYHYSSQNNSRQFSHSACKFTVGSWLSGGCVKRAEVLASALQKHTSGKLQLPNHMICHAVSSV